MTPSHGSRVRQFKTRKIIEIAPQSFEMELHQLMEDRYSSRMTEDTISEPSETHDVRNKIIVTACDRNIEGSQEVMDRMAPY